MSIERFKTDSKLKFRDGFQNGTRILKSQGLKEGTSIYNEFLLFESSFVLNEKQVDGGLIFRNEYNLHRTRILDGIYKTIDRIDLSDLESDFLNNIYDSNKENEKSPIESIEYEDSEDDLDIIEDNLNKNKSNDIEKLRSDKKKTLEKIINEKVLIPDDSIILRDNSLKQHEFVKCLMQCQEYISLEDYPRAFKQCEYIKNNLELKSAQLYEFYFISYFKIKGGEDSIIQDIENNKFDTISNLELYAKRCKKFNQEFHSTSTAEENIEIICRKLSDTLKERYLSIHFNYINFGNNIDIRNNIEKYINCGIDLVTEININKKLITSFLEFALIELNGGGRLDWIEVSSDWKIYNKTDSFNSIKKREQIEIIIRKRGRLEFTKKMLYKNLGLKYSNIKLNDDKSNILTATESTIKFIKSSIVAYKFYEDITFLELAFEELQGKGRISWYELNENNKIVPNKNCNKFNYNPYNDLIRIINKFGEKDAQSSTFNKILKDIVDYVSRQKELENLNQKILQIEKRYNEVEIVRLENGEIENDLEIRKEIINCIRLWWEMFLESRDQDKTLHKCIDELSGKGKLLWFNAEFVNNKDFLIVNHPNCNVLNFDAHNYLNDFCKKSSEYTDEEKMLELNNSIKLKIAEKLVYSANTKYNSI